MYSVLDNKGKILVAPYLIMEPVHVLLGVESPLSVVVLEGVGHWVMRLLEGEGYRLVRVLEWEEERIWRGVGCRERGTGGGAVPVLRAVAIALSCERMGLNKKQQTWENLQRYQIEKCF